MLFTAGYQVRFNPAGDTNRKAQDDHPYRLSVWITLSTQIYVVEQRPRKMLR